MVSVKGSFTPCAEAIEPLFGFSSSAGILAMHVNAIGTAINLRGAGFYQLQQGMLQAALAYVVSMPSMALNAPLETFW